MILAQAREKLITCLIDEARLGIPGRIRQSSKVARFCFGRSCWGHDFRTRALPAMRNEVIKRSQGTAR
jgi:hypothetical protein